VRKKKKKKKKERNARCTAVRQTIQLKRLQRELRNFDELSRSPVHRGYRDYETVNQMEDDAPPLRRLNSICQGREGKGKWFMIASPKRDGGPLFGNGRPR